MKRDFTGVFIPAHIWTCTELTPAEKMLLAEIAALSTRTGWCDASREHFAEWLQCDITNISHYTAKLEKLGFLTIKRQLGYRSKMQVVADRFYIDEGVNPIHGGSESHSRGVVNPIHGGGESHSPEIKEKIKVEIKDKKERAKRASSPEKKFHQKPLKERLNEVSIYAKEKNAPAAFFALIESPDFATLWEEYMEHRKKYKAKAFIEPRTEFAAIMKLFTFASFKMDVARKVVERSFDNGWQGFFELPKGENAPQNKTAPAPPQYEPPKKQVQKYGTYL